MLDKIAVVFVMFGFLVLLGIILYLYKYFTHKEFRIKTNEKRKFSLEIREIFKLIDYSYEDDNYCELLNIELEKSISQSVLNINKGKKLIDKNNFIEGNKIELKGLINISFNTTNLNDINLILNRFNTDNCIYINSNLTDIQKFKEEYYTKYNFKEIKNCYASVIFGERILELIQGEINKIYEVSKIEFQKFNLDIDYVDTNFINRIINDEVFAKSIISTLKISSITLKYVSLKLWLILYKKSLNEKSLNLKEYIEYWNINNLI